jgi:hypothetical protein
VCKPSYVVGEPRLVLAYFRIQPALLWPSHSLPEVTPKWQRLVCISLYSLSCSVLSCFPTRASRRCEQIKLILAKRTKTIILADAAHGSAVQINCASKHFSCTSYNQTYSSHATTESKGGRQSCQCPQPPVRHTWRTLMSN